MSPRLVIFPIVAPVSASSVIAAFAAVTSAAVVLVASFLSVPTDAGPTISTRLVIICEQKLRSSLILKYSKCCLIDVIVKIERDISNMTDNTSITGVKSSRTTSCQRKPCGNATNFVQSIYSAMSSSPPPSLGASFPYPL